MENNKFEIADTIILSPATDPRRIVTLRNEATSSEADIYLYGATVTAWRSHTLENRLFLSPLADLSGSKPIRGGIPVIFPQFGNGPLPAHGFARNSFWSVSGSGINGEGAPFVTLQLEASAQTLAVWPHKFIAEYTVILSDKLNTRIKIKNIQANSFSFQCALHTYFSVSKIGSVTVGDFSGITYIDKVKEQSRFKETSAALAVDSETDRIFLGAPDNLVIRDSESSKTISIAKEGFSDAVLWNPWEKKSAAMKDLAPDDYKRFICVESGQIDHPISLNPGESWEAHQSLGFF